MRVYGGMPVRQETGDMAMERQLPVMRLQSSEGRSCRMGFRMVYLINIIAVKKAVHNL